jgi:hypothetical protein
VVGQGVGEGEELGAGEGLEDAEGDLLAGGEDGRHGCGDWW